MSRRLDPRPGSAQHKLMVRLIELGGTARAADLMCVLSAEYRRVNDFHERICVRLGLLGFVAVTGDKFVALRAGKEYVAKHSLTMLPVPKKYVGQIAAPRTPQPARRAKISNTVGAMPIREGAFDYRNIPSLMGGSRVLPNGEVVD
jgi:hypothetical protein